MTNSLYHKNVAESQWNKIKNLFEAVKSAAHPLKSIQRHFVDMEHVGVICPPAMVMKIINVNVQAKNSALLVLDFECWAYSRH